MALSAGTTLGPYEILGALGAGGMGEVYRARDTKLNREVALKVLPELFALDPDRLARFKREAQVLASLNHPNIAAIYGFEESNGVQALVLELVEGPTLAERIGQRPMPLDDALLIARQIAEALEVAHEQGIIHRDLKPANVKLRRDGTVKVLDFGLAKAFEPFSAPGADVNASPTITTPTMTRMGVIVGTAAYMSPEQAKGKTVDKRADIFAFGCVLYEMLTGQRAFAGEDITDFVVAVMTKEPDWAALPLLTPSRIVELLRRCLNKDPRERMRDIGDARIEVGAALSEPTGPVVRLTEMPFPSRGHRVMPWFTAGLMTAIAAGAIGWTMTRPAPPMPRAAHLVIPLPADAPLAVDTTRPAVALSPDGSRLVYVANRGGKHLLYARRLDDFDVTPLPGTEGASGPFFSPDGRWVGFFTGYRLKKVSFDGGAPVTLGPVPPVTRGASWGPDDNIIYTTNPNGSFNRVPANGDPQSTIIEGPDGKSGERSHAWPDILPGGRAILFALDMGGSFDEARIATLSLDTKQKRVLVEGGTGPHYSSTGHVLFARAGSLFAVPFDRTRLEVRGSPIRVLDGVMMEPTGAAQIALSLNGTLAYVQGGAEATEHTLVWVDREGTSEPLFPRVGAYAHPAFSPDARRLALTIQDGSNYDIWVLELARTTLTRLTFHPDEDFNPVWSPDGRRIAFASEMQSMRGGGPNLAWIQADASSTPQAFLPRQREGEWNFPSSWSPDGRRLAYMAHTPEGDSDVWVLPLEGEPKPQRFVATEFREAAPAFSPDGRWVAYVSDESGRDEVYVRPYPGPGGKVQVSTEGASEPRWARSGQELFYRNGDKMMAVAVTRARDFTISPPRVLFEKRFEQVSRPDEKANYDVAADGRFVMIKRKNDISPMQIHVILNWSEELKRRVPPAR